MKKRIKDVVISFLIGCIFMNTTPVLADSLFQKIDIASNAVNIQVDDQNINMNSILYEDKVYVPIRNIAEIFNKDISWDQKTMTVNIKNNFKNDLKYEELNNMFSLSYLTTQKDETTIHYIYNEELSLDAVKDLILNCDEQILLQFSKDIIEENTDINNLKICFDYQFGEYKYDSDLIFEVITNSTNNIEILK